jgi:hypothetical protein
VHDASTSDERRGNADLSNPSSARRKIYVIDLAAFFQYIQLSRPYAAGFLIKHAILAISHKGGKMLRRYTHVKRETLPKVERKYRPKRGLSKLWFLTG